MTYLSDNNRSQHDRIPPDPVSPGEGVFRNFFYTGEQIRFPMSGGYYSDQPYPQVNGVYPPVTGSVRLFDMTTIPGRMGEMAATITKPPGGANATWVYNGPTLGAGLYALKMERAVSDPYWRKDQGSVVFAVVRQHASITRPPVDAGFAGLFSSRDIALQGFLNRASGMERLHLDVPPASGDSTNKVRSDTAWNESIIEHYNQFVKNADPVRKTRLYCAIRGGYGVSSAIAGGIRRAVQAYPEVDIWAWRNEPSPGGGSGGGNAGAWYKSEMKQFFENVHAASSTALAAGTDSTDAGTLHGIALGRQFFAPNSTDNYNSANYLDVMAEHYYPYGRGNWEKTRRMYQRRNELYAEFGAHTKLKVNSEAGSSSIPDTGIASLNKQAVEGICDLLGFEQMGCSVPGSSDGCMENWLYYYVKAHGDPFRSYLHVGNSVGALELLLYNHGFELYGCPNGNGFSNLSYVMDFGSRDAYLGGHVYNRRTNGTGVAVFANFGPRQATVRAKVSGSAVPSTLTFATGWGLEGTVPVETVGSDKFVTLTVGHPDPLYLRLPSGVNNEIEIIEPSNRGTKVSISGVTFNGPSLGSQTISSLVRGPLRDAWTDGSDNSGASTHAWEAGADLLPNANNTLTFKLPNFQIVKQVVINGLLQHQSESQILIGHLEFRGPNGNWTRAGDEINVEYTALSWTAFHDSRQAVISAHERVYELNVPNITADAIRLVVEKTTYGGTQDVNGLTGYGIEASYYGGTRFYGGVAAYQGAGQRIYLQRVEVFGVTAPGQPNPGGSVRAIFRNETYMPE